MTQKNLSTVAADVIAAYGITATNVINTTRFGGERMLGYADHRATQAMQRSTAVLNQRIRTDLSDGRERVNSVGVKALHLGTDSAQIVVGVAVDLATKGVNLLAAHAERLDRAANLHALTLINRVAMPAAIVVSEVAGRIEAGSSKLVQRVSGKPIPAKAVATRKLNTATDKAAAARKQATRTATKRVSKVVAQTATETSNAARRVARKAKATAAAA